MFCISDPNLREYFLNNYKVITLFAEKTKLV